MAETKAKKFGKKRQQLAEKIKEKGNDNLADTIKESQAEKLANEETIEAWKTAFPEYKDELTAIHVKAESYLDEGKEYYSPEKYFSRDSNGNLKFKPNTLAEELEEEYEFKYVEDTGQFYVYLDNYWQERAERVIKQECNKRLGSEYEPHYTTKTIDTINGREYVATKKKDFRPAKKKIPFKNCTYNLETGEKESHDPADNFTHKIPYELDRDAQCPEINNFLDEVVEKERDKEMILETIGYSMLADYPFEHALILYGGGKNGKSVLLNIWKKMLGEENYKEEDLQQLEQGRFATRWLYRKLGLFSDDMPGTKLESGSTLKSLTGGGDTRAEIKGGDHFEFKNFATPVFACNEIPASNDDSDGFYRRWEIVNFPYKFVDQPKKSNHKQKEPKDQLMQKLTDESEMEGLVNEALTSLELIFQNGGLYHKTEAESTRKLWKSYSNPFQQFVENCLEQGKTQKDAQELDDSSTATELTEYDYDFIVKDDLVWLISKYCEHYDQQPPTKTKLTRYLKNQSPYYVQEGRTRQLEGDNKRTRVYKFLKFSDEFLDFVDSKQKRPDCPYFFENLSAHARKVERSLSKSRDTKDTSPNMVGEMVEEFIAEQSQKKVSEQEVYENVDADREEIEDKISKMLREGDLYRPEPGKLAEL